MQASNSVFAAILTDGSVVTRGNKGFGGEGAQQIQSSDAVFASMPGASCLYTSLQRQA